MRFDGIGIVGYVLEVLDRDVEDACLLRSSDALAWLKR